MKAGDAGPFPPDVVNSLCDALDRADSAQFDAYRTQLDACEKEAGWAAALSSGAIALVATGLEGVVGAPVDLRELLVWACWMWFASIASAAATLHVGLGGRGLLSTHEVAVRDLLGRQRIELLAESVRGTKYAEAYIAGFDRGTERDPEELKGRARDSVIEARATIRRCRHWTSATLALAVLGALSACVWLGHALCSR